MKNQYVGDIGDLGKVLILKHLGGLGLRIGINWLLTEDDGTDDGKHRDYVSYRYQHCLCFCDRDLFGKIAHLAKKPKACRSISDLENLIREFSKSAVFYDEIYGPNCRRETLEENAWRALNAGAADLIFFDPDNGIGFGERKSHKHVYFDDMRRYWDRGQSLLTYHHLSRNGSHEEQVVSLERKFKEKFKEGAVIAYHLRRGTARVYLLCIHPNHQSITRDNESIASLDALLKTKGEWAKLRRHMGLRCVAFHSEIDSVLLSAESTRFK